VSANLGVGGTKWCKMGTKLYQLLVFFRGNASRKEVSELLKPIINILGQLVQRD